MKFVCPIHGVVTGQNIAYTLPATASCPVCLRKLTDEAVKGVTAMTAKEAAEKRPDYRP